MEDIGGNMKNNAMKTNIYILLLLSFSLLSCDPIIYLDTNREKKHNISCDCGMVEISSAVLTANLGILIKPIIINKSLEVDTDSLKIVLLPEEQYQDTKIYSSYNGKKINGKFVFEKNKNLYIGFEYFNFVHPIKSNPPSIMILPCGYIKCNDKPLITDTIRISLK
jgi:hypothetical protein